jgi:hypothetical protein
MGAWTADFVMDTVFWMMCHVCPWPTVRDSNWIGPPVMARAIASSLIEYSSVICTVFLLPLTHPATAQARTMVRLISLPALCMSLVSLVAFFVVMEKQFRSTFYARDARGAIHRRHWAEAEGRPTADKDRSLTAFGSLRYVGDLACAWIVEGAAKWDHSQEAAAWYTKEWQQAVMQAVRAHAHVLGPRAAEALAAMRDDTHAEPEDSRVLAALCV